MSYSNLNIPALLISDGSMQANCLGSYWDADRVGIMGPRQISDLKSVLTLTARKYRTDWLKWYKSRSFNEATRKVTPFGIHFKFRPAVYRRQISNDWHGAEKRLKSICRFFPPSRGRADLWINLFSFLLTAQRLRGKCASRSDPNIVFIIVIFMASTTMSSCVCVCVWLGIITMWCCHNLPSSQRQWLVLTLIFLPDCITVQV